MKKDKKVLAIVGVLSTALTMLVACGGPSTSNSSTDSTPNVDYVVSGIDCSGFVSWAINQGSKETFLSRPTGSLLRVGNSIDYTEAQAGDILVFNNGSEGHVVMVIENDPEAKEFLVVEASGSNDVVLMQTRSYSSLRKNNYIAKDLTELYGN